MQYDICLALFIASPLLSLNANGLKSHFRGTLSLMWEMFLRGSLRKEHKTGRISDPEFTAVKMEEGISNASENTT